LAIADYDVAIDRDPRFAANYIWRALAHDAAGNADASISDLNEYLRRDPRSAAIYCLRGQIQIDQRKFQAAIDDLNESIRLDPTDPVAFENPADAWKTMGNLHQAAKDDKIAARLRAASGHAVP
jgi:tetratricopeptide (TPR) repeat protein